MTINCTWNNMRDATRDAAATSAVITDEVFVAWPDRLHGATFHVAALDHFVYQGCPADFVRLPDGAVFYRAGMELHPAVAQMHAARIAARALAA